jgi:hypothetical protein
MDLISGAIITITIAGISGISVLATKSPYIFLKFKDTIQSICFIVFGILLLGYFAYDRGLNEKVELSVELYSKGDDWFNNKRDTTEVETKKEKEIVATQNKVYAELQHFIVTKELEKQTAFKRKRNYRILQLSTLALMLFIGLLYLLEHLAKISLNKQNEEKEKANSSPK